ncbi:telomerase RNA component interacting RNase [Anomaloglossus baeobatrachus]|uniref:telomerase RNA component interacting RNase n=1 Tax=Anomaloglossus baeobatrachus TaxID=238106 RepID=UPI003F50D131
MAERRRRRSPRPGAGEDAEEEGKEVESEEEAAAPDSPPPPPPGEASVPASSSAGLPSVSGVNLFANDGSFLELFKKKMEANSTGSQEESREPEERKEPDKRRPHSFVGKRRGGAKLALKTGMVTKKPKTEEEEILAHKGGAWAQYMAEVKKYKAHQCSDDDKTRPLVK